MLFPKPFFLDAMRKRPASEFRQVPPEPEIAENKDSDQVEIQLEHDLEKEADAPKHHEATHEDHHGFSDLFVHQGTKQPITPPS